jgi:hypothetical protein
MLVMAALLTPTDRASSVRSTPGESWINRMTLARLVLRTPSLVDMSKRIGDAIRVRKKLYVDFIILVN